MALLIAGAAIGATSVAGSLYWYFSTPSQPTPEAPKTLEEKKKVVIEELNKKLGEPADYVSVSAPSHFEGPATIVAPPSATTVILTEEDVKNYVGKIRPVIDELQNFHKKQQLPKAPTKLLIEVQTFSKALKPVTPKVAPTVVINPLHKEIMTFQKQYLKTVPVRVPTVKSGFKDQVRTTLGNLKHVETSKSPLPENPFQKLLRKAVKRDE
jgi:hypothetical protein